MKNFAQELRIARTKSKLTQKELAEKSGIVNITLSNYENGKAVPSVKTATNLAKAMNIPAEHFTRLLVPKESDALSEEEAISKVRRIYSQKPPASFFQKKLLEEILVSLGG